MFSQIRRSRTRIRPLSAFWLVSFALAVSGAAKLQASPFAYVANANGNSVSIIDLATLKLVTTVSVGAEPEGIAISPDGRFAYVANSGSNSVSVIDTATNSVTATFRVGASPIGIAFSPDGTQAYAVNSVSNSVSVIDTATTAVVATIPVGAAPFGVAFTPDGTRAYVTNQNDNTVSVISTGTHLVTATVPAGPNPRGVAITPDGSHAYVVDLRYSTPPGLLSVLDTGTNTVVATIPVGYLPIGVAVTPDGSRAYVAASYGPISVINTATNTVVASIPIPFGHPAGIAISGDGEHAYTPDQLSDLVSVNTATNQIDGEIPVAQSNITPYWVALTPTVPKSCGSAVSSVSIQPDAGGNTGSVSATLIGCSLPAGVTVKLTGGGQPDIVGTNTNLVSANTLTTTFNLAGAAPGARDIAVITSSGAVFAELPGAFTIEEGGAPNVWVDIIGRSVVRIGEPATFTLVVGNSGTVDSKPGLVSLSIPSTLPFTQFSGSGLYVAGSTSDPEYSIPGASTSNVQTLLFATGGVPAGQTQTASIQLTLPAGIPSDPTITAAWQHDLQSLSFDQYLLVRGVPYIPFQSACTQCYAQSVSEANAFGAAQTAYTAYQLAVLNEGPIVIASLAVNIGTAIFAAETSLSEITRNAAFAALTGSFLSDASAAAGRLAGGSASSALQELAISNAALLAKALLLGAGSPELVPLIGAAEALKASLSSLNSYADAFTSAQAAGAAFFPLFDGYQAARLSYQACLSQCTPPPPTPPGPNLGTYSYTFTGATSLDPNAKIGSQGAGVGQFISGATPLRYAVNFGNEVTATAPAQLVVITDQLDTTNDNLRSLSLGPMSFGTQSITPPPYQTAFSTTVDLRPVTDLLVAVNANLNASTGLLTWNFQSLDPSTGQPPTDPSVGFLPAGGNGSVFFTVMPKTGLETGTQINNQATVVFDENSPITTPTWFNTLDNTPPTSSVSPLPSTESCLSFQVVWAGTDVGSGIKDFTIFASDDGGAFAPWLSDTPATSATYAGEPGHSYSFYSIAEDQVGNIEAAKASAEASTEASTTAACGRPSLSGKILGSSLSGTTLMVNLQLTDTGSGDAHNIQISDFRLRVLNGTGTVAYLGPLPLSVGDVAIGRTTTATLIFSVPPTITKFVLTEDGAVQDVPGNTYNFSIGQVVFP